MHQNACLLKNPTQGGFVAAVNTELEDIYLHYSTKEFQWIQPGNDVCMVKRHVYVNQKKALSASLLDGEFFFTLYQSSSNTNQLPNRMGYFEELVLSLNCRYAM